MPATDPACRAIVGRHALCWLHADRLEHKLDASTDQQRAVQRRVRSLIWRFYADLKGDRLHAEPGQFGHMGSSVQADWDRPPCIPISPNALYYFRYGRCNPILG